jgi:hypothetical protein
VSETVNLNEIGLPHADFGVVQQWDTSYPDERVAVYFRNIKRHLISHIRKADYVFGCVAWLTDDEILVELSQKKGVCILVQKEDFLRPGSQDERDDPSWRENLHSLYSAIPGTERFSFHGCGIAASLSTCADQDMDAIRCVGVKQNAWRSAARMHNKFALFCKALSHRSPHPEQEWQPLWDVPFGVWTGSYNWSKAATRSFENCVYIEEPKAVKGFYVEFQQILALSEPCDWETKWVNPEYRIGT